MRCGSTLLAIFRVKTYIYLNTMEYQWKISEVVKIASRLAKRLHGDEVE